MSAGQHSGSRLLKLSICILIGCESRLVELTLYRLSGFAVQYQHDVHIRRSKFRGAVQIEQPGCPIEPFVDLVWWCKRGSRCEERGCPILITAGGLLHRVRFVV